MSEKKPHPDSTAHTPPQSIEEMLRERKELDRKLQANYTRDVTLMFTDIVGSTSFFDRRGDIEGRTMIQEHNDLLFPLIRAHHGTIIKTIGDAVMASFSNPEEAIRTAIDIQRTLRDHNQGKTADDHIRVRIGLNYGRGIVQDDDVFGDVVNVAARIESLAEADQILVSKPLYDQVRRTEDILCRYFDELQVKGKPEPLEIYRVVWGDEEMVMDKTRARGAAPLGKVGKPRKIFELNLSRDQDKITVSGYEKSEGEKKTIVHYENAQISPTEIDSSCLEITRLLNQANKQGKISKEILVRLQRGGQRLYDGLLTPKTRDQILKTDAEDLVLAIDDHLVHIPWELLYDGRQFFCQRFNMGRLVKTRQTIEGVKTRYVEAPLKMLILSNPKKDLPNSAQESIKLMEEVEKAEGRITATHKTGDVKTDQVKASMSHYDLVHYAGHADYDAVTPARSGWLLSNGSFTAEDIRSLAATTVMPALVFSNACHTGQTEEWKIDEKFQDNIYGLANAFLLAGVQHYVGTFWEIQDEAGSHFAMNFYHNLLEGSTVGEAVRAAREASIKRYGEETILWASYMLYGDPTTRYFDLSAHTAADESKKISGSQPPALAIPSSRRIRNKALIGTFIAALVLIVALIIWRLQPGELSLPKTPVEKAYALLRAGDLGAAERQFEMLSQTSGPDSLRGYEGLASVSFHRGDYQTADGLCRKVVDADPETIYARVILGNIAFNQGDLDAALKAYEAASHAKHGSPWQKAEAYNRLGRIYMERQKPESAFSSFDEALTLDPQNATVLSNKGTLLATLGKRDDAASLYRKALALSPSDSLTMTLLNQLLAEEKSEADKAQKERIDRLVVELSERFRNQSQESKPAYATDTWTSRPLSISFLALENRGAISLRAAENDYLVYTIIKSLQNKERISIIERELIDKLLQELNLSSSDLADPTTSIKLGKIVGARFIATGKVTRLGTELQVTLRVIETETTSVMGAFSEIVAQTVDLETAATMLADKISETLVTRFPLHAKIAAVDGDRVILNIGARAGAAVGVRMTVFQNGEPIIIDGRQIGNQKEEIGEIEIISVEEEMSTASAVTKNKDFTKDQRAVEIQPPSEDILETAV